MINVTWNCINDQIKISKAGTAVWVNIHIWNESKRALRVSCYLGSSWGKLVGFKLLYQPQLLNSVRIMLGGFTGLYYNTIMWLKHFEHWKCHHITSTFCACTLPFKVLQEHVSSWQRFAFKKVNLFHVHAWFLDLSLVLHHFYTPVISGRLNIKLL